MARRVWVWQVPIAQHHNRWCGSPDQDKNSELLLQESAEDTYFIQKIFNNFYLVGSVFADTGPLPGPNLHQQLTVHAPHSRGISLPRASESPRCGSTHSLQISYL